MFSEATIVVDCSTDVGFRAFCQSVHDRLAAVGLVQTADTGQIDLVTVVAPAGGAYAGYEIWRFDDAAQATDPLFLKLEYGRASTTSRPQARLQVGKGSDGAGTLTTANTATAATSGANPGATGRIVASLVNGAFVLLCVPTSSSGVGTMLFQVERLRDPVTFDLIAGAIATHTTQGPVGNFNIFESGAWGGATSASTEDVDATGAADDRLMVGYERVLTRPYAALRGWFVAKAGAIGVEDTGQIVVHGAAANYKRIDTVPAFSSPDGDVLMCTD